jgi:hypothetical protein
MNFAEALIRFRAAKLLYPRREPLRKGCAAECLQSGLRFIVRFDAEQAC